MAVLPRLLTVCALVLLALEAQAGPKAAVVFPFPFPVYTCIILRLPSS